MPTYEGCRMCIGRKAYVGLAQAWVCQDRDLVSIAWKQR
jgi:hypothetical protein